MRKNVQYKWEEPDSGRVRETWDLSEKEWEAIQNVLNWMKDFWKKEDPEALGYTIVKYSILKTAIQTDAPAQSDLQKILEDMAFQSRYNSGEGLYNKDCPIFTKHGINRSLKSLL